MLLDKHRLNTRKGQSLLLAELYKDIGNYKKYHSVANCQKFMEFFTDKQKRNYLNFRRNGCRDRFCPNCQRAYYLKNEALISMVLQYLLHLRTKTNCHPRYSLIFITPTLPNARPTVKSMKKVQQWLQYSIHNLIYSEQLCGWGEDKKGHKRHGRLLGAIVKYEQTVNHSNHTVNIHAHIIGIVHNSYYHSHYYLNIKKWKKLWNKATGGDYGIFVESPYYRDRSGKKRHNIKKFIHKVSAEIAKYETKSTDFTRIMKIHKKPYVNVKLLTHLFYCFSVVYRGSRHFITYGLFRKLLRQLKNNYKKFDKYKKVDHTVYALKAGTKWNNRTKAYIYKYLEMTDAERLELRRRGYFTTPLVHANSKFDAQDLEQAYSHYLSDKHCEHNQLEAKGAYHYLIQNGKRRVKYEYQHGQYRYKVISKVVPITVRTPFVIHRDKVLIHKLYKC